MASYHSPNSTQLLTNTCYWLKEVFALNRSLGLGPCYLWVELLLYLGPTNIEYLPESQLERLNLLAQEACLPG